MSETKKNVVTVNYNLHKDTAAGEMIESTEGKEPLMFLTGLGQMIPDFENKVKDLNVGDTFSFGIKSENAYGKRTDEAIIELPQDMFMKEGKLVEEVAVGNVLPLEDQNGQVHPAKIVSINKETITADVNHPLADQDLHFTGNIVEVREATKEEVEHGHVHGPGGHEH
ncbi:MAG: FKBP-type peptidyl-prolyl cis-trans isomerase [Flavobacteriales bacterium]|nr:FKBP-type peptidyl-prolyl cis-trans isomerase [Flavobacteriales bacterium]